MEEIVAKGEINKLKKEVLSKAELEGERMLEEAKKEMKELRKKELDKLEKELEKKVKDFELSEKERAESDIHGKKQELKAHYNELMRNDIERLINQALDNLPSLNEKIKKKIYEKMIVYAKKELGEIIEVKVPSDDYELVKKLIKNKIKLVKDDSIPFGIVAKGKDENVVVDLNIEHLKDELKEKVMAKVVERL